jgi:hypothetical protein
MGGLALNNRTIDKYFGYLRKLDNKSKKNLIIKLTESMDVNTKASDDIRSFFGSWEDTRDSDEIIKEIRDSRVDSNDIEKM